MHRPDECSKAKLLGTLHTERFSKRQLRCWSGWGTEARSSGRAVKFVEELAPDVMRVPRMASDVRNGTSIRLLTQVDSTIARRPLRTALPETAISWSFHLPASTRTNPNSPAGGRLGCQGVAC